MPEVAAEMFANVLDLKEIKHERTGNKVVIPSEKSPALEKKLGEILEDVHAESPHLKPPALKRRLWIFNWLFGSDPGYYVLFKEQRRGLFGMPRGLKRIADKIKKKR